MNIDEYRALKAEIESGGAEDAQAEQTPTATLEQEVETTPEVSVQPEPQQVETPTGNPEVQVEPDKLSAYEQELAELRQAKADADKQLQQASIAQEYYNKLMEDPEYAKVFAKDKGLTYIDPKEMEYKQLQDNYNSLLLERDIENMQIKYKDFDANQVIQFAVENSIGKLEDAYLLNKARNGFPQPSQIVDTDALREQIRQDILNELQSSVDTSSMIGTPGGGKPVQASAPELTAQESRVAKGLGMSPAEYAKWKNK